MLRRLAATSACLLCISVAPAPAADLNSFWKAPQHGGNSFSEVPPDSVYFEALAGTGATWVRLTFSKWKGEGRDFLLGDADHYVGLKDKDLAVLRQVLDAAAAAGLKVVIVPLSLPGARWIQQNNGKFDDRLWSDPAFAKLAVAFWTDLARALKDHPAIAAYNIINEPAPERTTGVTENGRLTELSAWQEQYAGSPRDLHAFYKHTIAAIRAVDPVTPIMVDAGYYANPRSLAVWAAPLADERVLYAVHMYEPYQATSAPNMKRSVPLRYPGTTTDYDGGTVTWDAHAVAAHLGAAFDWAATQG